jgi:hypothetical protein
MFSFAHLHVPNKISIHKKYFVQALGFCALSGFLVGALLSAFAVVQCDWIYWGRGGAVSECRFELLIFVVIIHVRISSVH